MKRHTTHPIAIEETRSISTPFTGSTIRLGTGYGRKTVWCHLGITQDIDGSWRIVVDRVGPGDHEDRPPEGSISIYDPEIAAFLEQLHALLEDPVAFESVEFPAPTEMETPS